MEPQTDQEPVQIAIAVPRGEQDEISNCFQLEGINFLAVSSQGFDGAQTIELLITLTPPVAAFLAGIYAKRIAANRHISLKYKGIEVKGVSERTLLKIIERANSRGKRK
jgi:hypothetical protein